ncbi:MAG: transcription elongation factor GreA [Chloroflexota bacterium]
MSDQQYLTEEGAAELRRELDDLIKVKRPQLAARLKEAISQGDLSENADYHDAKEQQAFLEGRILKLDALLHSAVIVADNGKKASVVAVGTEVVIQEGSEPAETYTIVGAAEADPRSGKISLESPLGRALMGHKMGDKVKVDAPAGELTFKIKAVK